MASVRVASLAQLRPGEMVEVRHNGQRYAVCHAAGEIFGIDGVCPHAGGPLAQGALHEHTVVCPWHAWEFDCRTGEYDDNPSLRLETRPVRVEHGDVYIDVP